MTGTVPGAVPARYTARAALGYAWVVFRTNPMAFLRLAILQALIFASTGFAMVWLMGWAGLNAEAPPAEQVAAALRVSALTAPVYLALAALSIWIEALWLDLFFNRPLRLWPGWSDYGRLLLSFLIVLAVFIAGYLGVLFLGAIIIGVTAAIGGAGPAIVSGLLVFAAFVAFLILVQMRFTALPGVVFMTGRIAVADAWRLSRGRMGALLLAWLGYAFAYLVNIAISVSLLSLTPASPWRAVQAAIEQPENPLAQYEVYSILVVDAGAAAFAFLLILASNLLFVPIMAVSRAIGVRLALEGEPE
ncbi:hypothetical protein ACWCOP_05605 [Maricaulaceae bacterium MS644]